MRYKVWEDSSLRKPHFSAISGSVILMRYLLPGYVILCGTGRHWRDTRLSTFPPFNSLRIGGLVKKTSYNYKGATEGQKSYLDLF